MPMFKIGDKILVFDKDTKELLLSGILTNITDNPNGLSMNNILFINPNSKRLVIKVSKDIIPVTTSLDLSKYQYYTHNNIDNTFDYDFFMWNEIEPEVKDTIHLLNKLGFIETYSSCSGHGKYPAYIDFIIRDYTKFFLFLEELHQYGLVSYTTKHAELNEGYKYRFIVGAEGYSTCHLELVEINTTFVPLNKGIKKYLLKQGI